MAQCITGLAQLRVYVFDVLFETRKALFELITCLESDHKFC